MSRFDPPPGSSPVRTFLDAIQDALWEQSARIAVLENQVHWMKRGLWLLVGIDLLLLLSRLVG